MNFVSLNNNTGYSYPNANFRAASQPVQTNDPIEKIANKIDEEKKKKHNKTAMAVGGSVLGLSLLVTALNPKISTKLIENLKNLQLKTNKQLERSKGHLVKTKFYKFVAKAADWSSRFLSWTNNVNSVKDTYYKQLCTEDKTFSHIKSLERRKRFAKYDKVFRRIMQKPHELITKWGDALAKKTVRRSYKKAAKKMDNLENLISNLTEKLPNDKKAEIKQQLLEIRKNRNCFSQENLTIRFEEQGDLMKDLDNKIRRRWKNYKHGFSNKHVSNSKHFAQNLSFWAQDIMAPEREAIGKKGLDAVESLVGNSNGVKGEYQKLIEKMTENLNQEESAALAKALKKADKSLRNANTNECCSYFDKKRDLVLGSAPTDILSGVLGLALGGASLISADDRDKRISRLITKVLPVIAGLGTNIALTAMLFSGTKSMLYGIVAGGVLSLIGSKIDKARLSVKNKLPDDELDKATENVKPD